MRIVKEGTSKKGTPYLIRYIEREDVHTAWEYINALSKEKTFIRFQGEEVTLEKEAEHIEKSVKKIEEGRGVILALIVDGKYSGISEATLRDKTESHVANMGLSVSANVRGEGLGRELFESVISEAINNLHGLRILTLEVKAPNDIGMSLYTSCGFIEFGRLPLGTMHQDQFVDEVFMYKLVV